MRKQIVALVLVVAFCGGCAEVQSGAAQKGAEVSSASLPSLPLNQKDMLADYNGVALQFVPPKLPYEILGVTALNDGYAIVYQEEMPDEFNKIYSRDSIFYALYTQIFDAAGAYIETVDSQRRNAIKIEPPVYRLRADGEAIRFEVWNKNSADKTEAVCFMLAVNAQGAQKLGYNPNNYFYRQQEFCELTADGETQLQYASVYNYDKEKESLLFRLASPEGDVRELMLDFFDASFQNALYNAAHGVEEGAWLNAQDNPLYRLNLRLDADAQKAELSNGKITCELNFTPQNARSDVSRNYTADMLGQLAAASPNGSRRVYSADVRYYFESVSGCDYVLQNEKDEIVFLFAGSDMDELHFLDNDRIWANTFSGMAFYDAQSGKPTLRQPQFDFGQQPNPYDKSATGAARMILGTAVDVASHHLLVAHRPYTFGSGVLWPGTDKQTEQLPVALTVLDWQGEPLKTFDTGLTMRAFGKFFLNTVSVVPNGDGSAVLTTEGKKPVTVAYAGLQA